MPGFDVEGTEVNSWLVVSAASAQTRVLWEILSLCKSGLR